MTPARDIAFAVLGSLGLAGFAFGTMWIWLALGGAILGTGR